MNPRDRLEALLAPDLLAALEQLIDERVAAALAAARADAAGPRWLSVPTAAQYLDVSTERIRKLVARREIPYSQEGPGCRVFFDRRDLDDWMRGQAR